MGRQVERGKEKEWGRKVGYGKGMMRMFRMGMIKRNNEVWRRKTMGEV